VKHPAGSRHLDAAPHGATRGAIPISTNSNCRNVCKRRGTSETQTRRRAGGGDSLSPLTGAEGGRAALAPEPDGTRGGEPTEADGAAAAAAAAVAVAKRAQAGLHLLF